MRRLAFWVLIGFAVSSCAPAYIANTRNVPMFSESNEFSANVSYFSGIDAQVAYSFSDHIAAMANGNMVVRNGGFAEAYVPPRPNHLFGEAGIGYFTRKEELRLEVFGGYGVGTGYSREPNELFGFGGSEIVVKREYERIFLQPSLGIQFEETELVITSRFSAVNFTSYAATVDTQVGFTTPPTAGYNIFFEPALTWRFHMAKGFQPLLGYIQICVNAPLTNVNYRCNYFQVATGIQLHSRLSRKHVD